MGIVIDSEDITKTGQNVILSHDFRWKLIKSGDF